MYCLAALLAFLSLAESRPFQVNIRPTISINPYLIGGVNAEPGEFPWQLSMLRSGSHSCGGSLLSSIASLTVAHCVDGALISSIDIIAGLYQRSNRTGTQTSAAASVTIHASYDNGEYTLAHDIAIITLATPIDTSPSHIEAMTLPPDNSYQFTGDTCKVSGWGYYSDSNILANTLQKIDMEVISTAECNRLMIGVIGADCSDNHLPLFDYAEAQGACNGDSGSPVSCPLGGETVVAGIISYVISSGGQCMTTYPTFSTRTGVYLQWIADNAPIPP